MKDPWRNCEQVRSNGGNYTVRPRIRPSTLALLERVEDGAFTLDGIRALKRCRNIAQKCLDRFQKRVKVPVNLVSYDGVRLMARGEFMYHLNSALYSVSNPLLPGVLDSDVFVYGWVGNFRLSENNYGRRLIKYFPELCELWWIAYELDSAPGRPGLLDMAPTTKPKAHDKNN